MPIWCTFFSVSNIHKNFGNRKWVCPICTELFPICIYTHLTHNWLKKHKLKVMIRILRMKEIFMYRPLFFEWMGVFQSSLDCFSIGVWAFIKNIDFLIFSSLCMLVFICYNSEMLLLAVQLHFLSSASNCLRYVSLFSGV